MIGTTFILAIEKIEPNIIVEFARIFGFEVDFQRDIRKGDWFEHITKNLKMIIIK